MDLKTLPTQNYTNTFPKQWILIRGLTRSRFHWFDFDQKFKNYFSVNSVFCTELAGCGDLYEQKSSTNLDSVVHQLKEQYELYKKDNNITDSTPVGIIGISMGGMIATRWTELYSTEVSQLVLINTSFASLSSFFHRLRPQNYLKMILVALKNEPEKIERFIYQVTSNDESKWLYRFDDIVRFQKNHPISFSNFVRQLSLSGLASFKEKPIEKILILSSLNDRLVNSDCSEKISTLWNCPLETHPTAGHDLPLDDPNWILQKIEKHFKN